MKIKYDEAGLIIVKIGNGLFSAELVDYRQNIIAWLVNIDGPTVWHKEVDGTGLDVLDVAHEVLTKMLQGECKELPSEVLNWVDDYDTELERVRAFCDSAVIEEAR